MNEKMPGSVPTPESHEKMPDVKLVILSRFESERGERLTATAIVPTAFDVKKAYADFKKTHSSPNVDDPVTAKDLLLAFRYDLVKRGIATEIPVERIDENADEFK